MATRRQKRKRTIVLVLIVKTEASYMPVPLLPRVDAGEAKKGQNRAREAQQEGVKLHTIALEGNCRHDREASHEQQEQDAGPEIIVLGLLDLERLLERHLFVAILKLGRLLLVRLLIWLLLVWLVRRRVWRLLRLGIHGRVSAICRRRILLLHCRVAGAGAAVLFRCRSSGMPVDAMVDWETRLARVRVPVRVDVGIL